MSDNTSSAQEHLRGSTSGPDIQRQLDALNAAERLRASSVSAATAATGNSANSSGSMLSSPSTALSDFFIRTKHNISPLFQQDDVRGKAVLLRIVGEINMRKGKPLPPALTGMSTPTWNPMNNTFPFQLGNERGSVKIAGQDVDLFKFWQAIFANGMTMKVTRESLWPQVAAQLGLPPTLPDGVTPTSSQVQEIGIRIFMDMEVFLHGLMQASSKRPQQQLQPNMGTSTNAPPQATQVSPSTPIAGSAQTIASGGGPSTPAQASDDSDSRKRKAEGDEDDESKRAKIRKTEEDTAMIANTNTDTRASPVKEEPQPEGPLLRRKIQYVPVVRTINTYGGRDLEAIEHEHQAVASKLPLRKMEDFGIVDVDTLILQLRSRLKVEVTTALGLLHHLAFLRGGDRGNAGLQLSVCEELTDELLDLLEETAFANSPDVDDPDDAKLESRVITNRELMKAILEEGSELFGGVKADRKFGLITPTHQPWEVVTIIVTILCSVASADENPPYLASRPRLLDIVTRVCMIRPTKEKGEPLKPCSDVLQLRHLLRIRKEATSLVGTIAPYVNLSQNPPRVSRRLYLLLASTLMDSEECIPPGTPGRTPSKAMELALDAFTQIAHPDLNRQAISAQVPWEHLWSMVMMLVRILPLTDADIQQLVHSAWLSFILKAALAIYSLAVAAPLPMRHKMKASPSLRGALTRFLRIGTTVNSAQNNLYRTMPLDARQSVEEYWKRIGETLKVIDAEEDPLAPTSSGSGGLVGYGIGGSYDLHIGAKPPARGTGMFGGSRSDYLWSVMSTAAAQNDIQAFEEWDYMLRVDSSMASRV